MSASRKLKIFDSIKVQINERYRYLQINIATYTDFIVYFTSTPVIWFVNTICQLKEELVIIQLFKIVGSTFTTLN